MLRNYLTELKNILIELNPYKAILFGSYADGEDLCAAESLLQSGQAWMEGIRDNQESLL